MNTYTLSSNYSISTYPHPNKTEVHRDSNDRPVVTVEEYRITVHRGYTWKGHCITRLDGKQYYHGNGMLYPRLALARLEKQVLEKYSTISPFAQYDVLKRHLHKVGGSWLLEH